MSIFFNINYGENKLHVMGKTFLSCITCVEPLSGKPTELPNASPVEDGRTTLNEREGEGSDNNTI